MDSIPETRRQFDAVVERFREDWHTDRRPQLTSVLEQNAALDRTALLRELLRVEIEQRRAAGEQPTMEEYCRLLSNDADTVRQVFASVETIGRSPSRNDDTLTYSPGTGDSPASADRLGDFELLERIGRGGMGVVYRARQISLDRLVALKMIHAADVAEEDEEFRRFQSEARSAAALKHPGIVPVYQFGHADGKWFLAMELVEGGTLSDLVQDGPLDPRRAAELVRQTARAVAAAHARGVVHRDLKPGNVLLDELGEPKVTDFGLAQRTSVDSRMTVTGQILGTPSYMPPEQARGDVKAVGPLSDVYSLGAILYCLLTGRPPFQAAGVMETLQEVLNRQPIPPSRLNREVPRTLELICLRCLQKSPADRFPSAEVLADSLDRCLRSEPVPELEDGRAARVRGWCRQHQFPVVLSMVVVAAVCGLLSLVLSADRPAPVSSAVDRSPASLGSVAPPVRSRKEPADDAISSHEIPSAPAEAGDSLTVPGENEADGQHSQDVVQEYAARIAGAQSAWKTAGSVRRAFRQLESASRQLRGWEHDYLYTTFTTGYSRLGLHTGGVTCLAVSPDSTRVASGSSEQTVKIWDVKRGQEVLSLSGHTGQVRSVAFSSDGGRILSAGDDGTVRIHNAQTGEERQTFREHSGKVKCAVFSPDGTWVVSGGDELKAWNVESGKERFPFDGGTGTVYSVAFSPDGMQIVSGGSQLRLWDAQTGSPLLTLRGPRDPTMTVFSVVFSPDGQFIAGGCADDMVRVWDAASGEECLTLRGHTDVVASVAFSPDGRSLISGGWDDTVRVWNVKTGEQTAMLPAHTWEVWSVAYSPDGAWFVSGSNDSSILMWQSDVRSGPLKMKGIMGFTMCVAFAPDSGRLATGNADGTVQIHDSRTGEQFLVLPGHSGAVTSVSFSPDGSRIVSGSHDQTVRIRDAGTGEELATLEGHDATVWSVAFSPDGQLIASGGGDSRIRMWEADTGRPALEVNVEGRGLLSLAFSPEGDWLAGVGYNSTIGIWDTGSGQPEAALQSSAGSLVIRSVDCSPDGRRLLSGGDDGVLTVWDVEDHRELLRLEGHTGGITGASFSPDGRRIVSGSRDGTIRLWDVLTGTQLLMLKAHDQRVTSVAFSADGRLIASGGLDRTVKIWDGSHSASDADGASD